MPQEKLATVGEVQVAQLAPDDGIVLPTKGKIALKRVFLGLGWAADPKGPVVDIDVRPSSEPAAACFIAALTSSPARPSARGSLLGLLRAVCQGCGQHRRHCVVWQLELPRR